MNNKDSKFNKNLTKEDYDGVIYTPSSESKHKSNIYKQTAIENNPKTIKRKPPKSQYKAFMIATIISGVVICVTVFALVYNSVSEKAPKLPDKQDISGNDLITKPKETKTEKEFVTVIKNIDIPSKRITLYNVDTKKSFMADVPGSADLKDKYDKNMALAEFSEGDIVNCSFDAEEKLISLKENNEYWEMESVTGVSINTESKNISKDNKTYIYDDMVISKYKDKDYDIGNIDSTDTVTIKVYKNTVYFINLEKGHGTIKINNKETIKDGSIEIDTTIYKSLSEANEIKVSEGNHKIVIKGSNTEPFSQEIFVSASETYLLDLSSVQVKSGVLLINVNIPDYTLYVNDIMETSREPLMLDYGAYKISIKKEGYVSYETQIVINKSQTNLNAELKKEVKMGKLTINTTPVGATLFVDNINVGLTPISKEFEYGYHTITIRKPGYNEFVLESVLIGEKENLFNIELHPEITTNTNTTTTTTSPNTTNTTTSNINNNNTNNTTTTEQEQTITTSTESSFNVDRDFN